jgi:hypothetical protein
MFQLILRYLETKNYEGTRYQYDTGGYNNAENQIPE